MRSRSAPEPERRQSGHRARQPRPLLLPVTIPFDRDNAGTQIYKHLGLYAYRAAALHRFHALQPSPLELTERLEQLRFLENNIPVHVVETPFDTVGVDTEADLYEAEQLLSGRVL